MSDIEPSSMQANDLVKSRIERSSKYIGWMILTITAISGIISIIVVVSVVAIALMALYLNDKEAKIPDVLSNWGGIILGFYFGQFVNVVKDYMGILENGQRNQ